MSDTISIERVGWETIEVEGADSTVTIERSINEINIESVGIQGPVGPSGTSLDVTKIAGTAIGGQRAVYVAGDGTIMPFNSSTIPSQGPILGVTVTSVSGGGSVSVRTSGELQEGSFSFTPGQKIFADSSGSGVLTQTPPTAPCSFQPIGHAIASNKIIIQIEPQIERV